MRNDKENEIVKVSFEFALMIIEYCEKLESLHKYVIARQLLKSGTSIGANIREAQNAESKPDFIHKLKIAAKEAKNYPYDIALSEKLLSILKLLGKILGTIKRH